MPPEGSRIAVKGQFSATRPPSASTSVGNVYSTSPPA
ncbi:MAG: hypothetical protein ACI8WY_000546, partial [Planctomycetota bacterium]